MEGLILMFLKVLLCFLGGFGLLGFFLSGYDGEDKVKYEGEWWAIKSAECGDFIIERNGVTKRVAITHFQK